MAGNSDLESVVANLSPNYTPSTPDALEQAVPLQFVDTSLFANLSGITGYRIDRHAPDQYAVNWVADDFQFSPAATVPIPGAIFLFGWALIGLAGFTRR